MMKKYKLKTKKLNSKQGYTIVELLAVVSILVIISGIISGILYSTLRGTGKTRINTEVSQSGAYALSVFTNAVVDSGSVTQINDVDISDCTASPSGTSVTLRRLDGATTKFSCTNNTINKDDVSIVNNNIVSISNCSFTCKQKTDDSYSIPSVDISFTVSQKAGKFVELIGTSTFNTSVTMRNYAP